MKRECLFSICRRYRYKLDIIWDPSIPPQAFIGLNPSTADEENDDPTVRRCINFAKKWGAGGLRMLNAYSYRSTDPKILKSMSSPYCPMFENYDLNALCDGTFKNPIAAWGVHVDDGLPDHQFNLLDKILHRRLDCLGKNKNGTPKHPLYLKSDTMPRPFNYAKIGPITLEML
jgi:hypothetical protein